MNGLHLMLLKKTSATRSTAQEELTPPEEFLDLAKRPCTGKKFTISKNTAPEMTHAADAAQDDEL